MKRVIIAAAVCVWSGLALAEDGKLVVNASASVQVVPNVAIVQAGAVTEAASAAQCHARNRAVMDAVHKKLKAFGLDDKALSTSEYSLQPKYAYEKPDRTPRIAGYTLTHMFAITLKDVPRAGELVDALIEAGADKIGSVTFSVEDDTAYRSQARALALKNARKKADELAAGAGTSIKGIISIEEGESAAPPVPMRFFAKAVMDTSAPTPVMAGQSEITETVTITYSLKQ